MAYRQTNLAYDLRLFEEPYYHDDSIYASAKKPKEKENSKVASAETQKQSSKKRAKKRKSARSGRYVRISSAIIVGLLMMVAVAAIIHGQVELTELNQEIIDARSDLAEKQSVYTQLEMKVDSSISTSVVEDYAQSKLNMNKATNSQKEFISLSEGDKAEVTLSSHSNIFEAIADLFSNLFS